MESWRLLNLGYSEPLVAQTFYETVAEAVHRGISPNTLILLQPDSPYACLGYHQDLEKELDLEFCEEADLPLIRRSQGFQKASQPIHDVVKSLLSHHSSSHDHKKLGNTECKKS